MEIYILRHGIAEEGRAGQADADRRLTPEGKDKLRRILSRARIAGVRPELILSSPYKRAMETAALAAEELEVKSPILETRALTPTERPEAVWEEIRLHKDAAQLLLAGHEPQLSALVCYLIGARAGAVELKKGAIARVDAASLGPRPDGVLIWLLTAKLANS
jgi:phosphohistidine phosphatase